MGTLQFVASVVSAWRRWAWGVKPRPPRIVDHIIQVSSQMYHTNAATNSAMKETMSHHIIALQKYARNRVTISLLRKSMRGRVLQLLTTHHHSWMYPYYPAHHYCHGDCYTMLFNNIRVVVNIVCKSSGTQYIHVLRTAPMSVGVVAW